MRLDLFAKFKYESSTVIVFVCIRYSMRDLLSDLNNYAWRANIAICIDDMRHIRWMTSALPLAAARLSWLWILCLNDLLHGDLCKHFFYFHILFFSGFWNTILSHALILAVSQLQTEQVLTSQIRSHIEYLIHTYYILVLILQSKLMKNIALMAGLNTIRDSGIF